MKRVILIFLVLFPFASNAQSGGDEFWDPFEFNPVVDNREDQEKSVDTLIREASTLIYDQPLTARSKLTAALKKDPRSILTLNMLGSYYMTNVGHYRLALKYFKKAEQVLFEEYGKPPYIDYRQQILHSEILRQLGTVRQNLDLYQQALNNLNEYESYGYTDPYLESSRAWIYFKLKQHEKGIEEAKNGIRNGAAIGNNLNILGILYSVTGEKEKGIQTLAKAYDFEKSLGSYGRSATPLNNMGEVYRELFKEDQAASSWESALRLPDGCEHILPSLNLAIIHIEGLRLKLADSALKNFKSCFAQYPLRNNEEHQSLLELILGRIRYYQGDPAASLEHYQKAIEHQQWFGSIGANIEDLQSAIYSDYSKSLLAYNNHLRSAPKSSYLEKLASWKQIFTNYLKASWYDRKAKLLLLSYLEKFEDLDVRHTDSLLDYPSLGFFFQSLPKSTARRVIAKQQEVDKRPNSKFYYQTYLASNLATHGAKNEAQKLLQEVINEPKIEFDQALKAQALVQLIQISTAQNQSVFIEKLFKVQPAAILNNNLKFPVTSTGLPSELVKLLEPTNLDLTSGKSTNFQLTYSSDKESQYLTLRGPNNYLTTVQGKDYLSLINSLIKQIFTEHE